MEKQERNIVHDKPNESAYRGIDVAGPRNGPPIIFLHCAGATRKIWLPQMRRLADTFRLIALDLPGHGAFADRPFSLPAAREHVSEVIQEWAGGSALLVGLSLGGYVAIDVAYHHPYQVAGLVLSGASANGDGVVGCLSRLGGTLLITGSVIPVVNMGLQWLIRTWLHYQSGRGLPEPEARVVQDALTEASIYPRAAGNGFLEVARQDSVPQVGTYPEPVLIVNGAYEKISRSGETELLAATQNGQLCIIPHACHATNLEQPDAFSDTVRRFATAIAWQIHSSTYEGITSRPDLLAEGMGHSALL